MWTENRMLCEASKQNGIHTDLEYTCKMTAYGLERELEKIGGDGSKMGHLYFTRVPIIHKVDSGLSIGLYTLHHGPIPTAIVYT